MELLTGAILSGIIYDMLKRSISLTADNLKTRLQHWIIEDSIAIAMQNQLQKLDISEEMSELAIEKKIVASKELYTLMEKIKPNGTIIQNHSGTGDNVAGNKIINKS